MLTPLAHPGAPPAPHDLWSSWAPDPVAVVAVVAVVALHLRGRRHGPGATRRTALFGAAVAAAAVAVLSPLDTVASALASAHMAQHLLLVLVAAPLWALAAPGPSLARGLPRAVPRHGLRVSEALGLTALRRLVGHPAVAWSLHVATLWFWHASGPYQAALRHDVLHGTEHLTLLATGVVAWQAVEATARRGQHGVGVLLVFGLAVQGVLLGALLTFARTPFYDAYRATAPAWGLSALDDQHLAGVLLWVPSGAVHLAAALVLLGAWIRSTERTSVAPR